MFNSKIWIIILSNLIIFDAYGVDASKWSIHAGNITIDPHEESGEITGIQGSAAGTNSDTVFGLIINYALSYHWKTEFFLTTGFNHSLYGKGTVAALGKTSTYGYDAPTIFFQYWFDDITYQYHLRPYLGIGITYVKFRDEKATPSLDAGLGGPTSIDVDSVWGGGIQAGLDWEFIKQWSINANIIWTDLEPTTSTLTTQNITRTIDINFDPYVYMVHLGYKF